MRFVCLFQFIHCQLVIPVAVTPIRTIWCSFLFVFFLTSKFTNTRQISIAISLFVCRSVSDVLQFWHIKWKYSKNNCDCRWKLKKRRFSLFDIATCKFHVISGNCSKRRDGKRRNRYLLHEFAWFTGHKIQIYQLCWVSTPSHFNHFQQLK